MANTISIGQLRQNPTAMIREVRAGASYVLTDHGEPVADIVPHRDGPWRPGHEVARILAEIGPDPEWAEWHRNNRLDLEFEDPWERYK